MKFCGSSVPPFGTAIVAAEPGSKPGLLAVSDGYVPAGTLNEYWPLPFVVVVRLPSAMVAPEIGLAPSVTVPESVPLPTGVQPGIVERADAGLVVQPGGRVVLAGHPELAAVRVERHAAVVAPADAGRAPQLPLCEPVPSISVCSVWGSVLTGSPARRPAYLICGFVVEFDFV